MFLTIIISLIIHMDYNDYIDNSDDDHFYDVEDDDELYDLVVARCHAAMTYYIEIH